MLPKLICLVGSTASGKTALGIRLAKKFGGEIISADSRQIYSGMDIGTAKVSGAWKEVGGHRALLVEGIPHYGIDLVRPDEPFTVADFQRYAFAMIADSIRRKKVPFLVGGTGLYVQAVVDNFSLPHVPPNAELRKKIANLVTEKGLHAVYLELLKLDPDAADFVAPQNARRVIRALEVCLATGRPFSKQKKRGKKLYSALQIAIDVPRATLYPRINDRADAQIRDGLVDEVRELVKKYDVTLPSFSGIGYFDIARAITGEISLATAVDLVKRRTRVYARRQLTWFRRDKRIKWVTETEEADALVARFLRV